MKLSRDEAGKIADAVFDANFRVYGIGHFDISRNEFTDILMVSVNRSDRDKCLQRYYRILHDKVFGRSM